MGSGREEVENVLSVILVLVIILFITIYTFYKKIENINNNKKKTIIKDNSNTTTTVDNNNNNNSKDNNNDQQQLLSLIDLLFRISFDDLLILDLQYNIIYISQDLIKLLDYSFSKDNNNNSSNSNSNDIDDIANVRSININITNNNNNNNNNNIINNNEIKSNKGKSFFDLIPIEYKQSIYDKFTSIINNFNSNNNNNNSSNSNNTCIDNDNLISIKIPNKDQSSINQIKMKLSPTTKFNNIQCIIISIKNNIYKLNDSINSDSDNSNSNNILNNSNNQDFKSLQDSLELKKEINDINNNNDNDNNDNNRELALVINKSTTIKKNLNSSGGNAMVDILSHVSHELRTPLVSIVASTQLFSATDLSVVQKEYLAIIDASSRSILDLIENVLDYGKIGSGKMTLNNVDFNLCTVIEDVCSIVSPQAQSKGIQVASYIFTHCPLCFYGDPIRLRQILLNLMGNGIKFTKEGQVIISVEPIEVTDSNITLQFQVKDTGIGISRENEGKLFSMFSQVHNGNIEQEKGGSGLGLAISKELVQLMGGRIWYEPNGYNQPGSSFFFEVTFETNPKQLPCPVPNFNEINVLIADKNPDIRAILVKYLSEWNCNSIECSSCEGAMNEIKARSTKSARHRIDVLLIDVEKSQWGEFVELKRTIDFGFQKVGIVLMSKDRAMVHGISYLGISKLTKPIRQSHLSACLLACIPDSPMIMNGGGSSNSLLTNSNGGSSITTSNNINNNNNNQLQLNGSSGAISTKKPPLNSSNNSMSPTSTTATTTSTPNTKPTYPFRYMRKSSIVDSLPNAPNSSNNNDKFDYIFQSPSSPLSSSSCSSSYYQQHHQHNNNHNHHLHNHHHHHHNDSFTNFHSFNNHLNNSTGYPIRKVTRRHSIDIVIYHKNFIDNSTTTTTTTTATTTITSSTSNKSNITTPSTSISNTIKNQFNNESVNEEESNMMINSIVDDDNDHHYNHHNHQIINSTDDNEKEIMMASSKQQQQQELMTTPPPFQSPCLTSISTPPTTTTLTTLTTPRTNDHNNNIDRIRVLIVDDNVVNLKLTQKFVDMAGYPNTAVSNAQDALNVLDNGRYSIILMDCEMPNINGFQCTEFIREREMERLNQTINQESNENDDNDDNIDNYDCNNDNNNTILPRTVIIALTAHSSNDSNQIQKCYDAGMDDFISKPFKPNQLESILEKWENWLIKNK